MSTVTVWNQQHEEVGELALDESIFGVEVKEHLMHMAVRKQLAARRAGTHAVKRRAQVRGGGRKPFRQKGTGRARQGTIRAAQMRGGGVVFGPEVRSHDFKVNRKEMRAALCSALTRRASEGAVSVVDSLCFETPKTKDFLSFLASHSLSNVLLVASPDENLRLSARNLKGVTVLPAAGVNVYDILRRNNLVVTKEAMENLVTRLGGNQ